MRLELCCMHAGRLHAAKAACGARNQGVCAGQPCISTFCPWQALSDLPSSHLEALCRARFTPPSLGAGINQLPCQTLTRSALACAEQVARRSRSARLQHRKQLRRRGQGSGYRSWKAGDPSWRSLLAWRVGPLGHGLCMMAKVRTLPEMPVLGAMSSLWVGPSVCDVPFFS